VAGERTLKADDVQRAYMVIQAQSAQLLEIVGARARLQRNWWVKQPQNIPTKTNLVDAS